MPCKQVSGYHKGHFCSANRSYLAFALYFVPRANEKYYDLAGALGFLSTAFVSLYYPSLVKLWDKVPGATFPALDSFASRQLLATAVLSTWSVRLGTFLVMVSHGLGRVGPGYMRYN